MRRRDILKSLLGLPFLNKIISAEENIPTIPIKPIRMTKIRRMERIFKADRGGVGWGLPYYKDEFSETKFSNCTFTLDSSGEIFES